MATISLHHQQFNYTINRKGVHSLRLRLLSPTSFQISCPYLTPNFFIDKFIQDNATWIVDHAQKLPSKTSILSLSSLTILDQKYQLSWFKTNSDSVLIFDHDHQIVVNLHLFSESHASKILEAKLRPLALSLIKKELSKLSDEYHFKYNKVTVRNQSSRYGSCSSTGNLNFNWQIIFFPYPQFRHILLHELTHLEIKNHSQKFWSKLATYDSKSRYHNLWLKKEGTKHFLF